MSKLYVRKEIDIDSPIYFDKMNVLEKLTTSIRYNIKHSEGTKRRARERERRKNLRLSKKTYFLQKMLEEEIDKYIFKKGGDYVDVEIRDSYTDVLIKALKGSTFSDYKISILSIDNNLKKAFPKFPRIVRIERVIMK